MVQPVPSTQEADVGSPTTPTRDTKETKTETEMHPGRDLGHRLQGTSANLEVNVIESPTVHSFTA